ncbi:hypothetical protein ACEN19_00075 [Corynebacterium auriscanis]|uniref:hypothetical protein n=1 Tax=Corynebacterium auriscanis TaxID=99807 RepID=UPI003CF2FD49
MGNIQDLADRTDITAHDIALAAFHDGLAEDYEPIQFESGYRLTHPTNESMSLVFDVETGDNGQIDGWSYTIVETEDEHRTAIGTDGDGLNAGQPLSYLLESIENTLTEWAK